MRGHLPSCREWKAPGSRRTVEGPRRQAAQRSATASLHSFAAARGRESWWLARTTRVARPCAWTFAGLVRRYHRSRLSPRGLPWDGKGPAAALHRGRTRPLTPRRGAESEVSRTSIWPSQRSSRSEQPPVPSGCSSTPSRVTSTSSGSGKCTSAAAVSMAWGHATSTPGGQPRPRRPASQSAEGSPRFPQPAFLRLRSAGGRVGRRPIPEGPTYEVEVKSGVEVVRAGSGGPAGVPAELILVAVVRCCGRCPASVSGPT